ncbi:hypothetical protein HN011_007585 [Eciton burchellii]|nr:hypothetical protein HN011_007585 [Eciton burchellii]
MEQRAAAASEAETRSFRRQISSSDGNRIGEACQRKYINSEASRTDPLIRGRNLLAAAIKNRHPVYTSSSQRHRIDHAYALRHYDDNRLRKDEYFMLILGIDNAGKTTHLETTKTRFTRNYKGMNPSKIATTVGLNIGKIDTAGVSFNFWDLDGQEERQSC